MAALEIGKLPTLTIVRLDSILLHEELDRRRFEPLKERIASEGCIRNPPIAARDGDSGAYILLDGANRIGALKDLGAKFVVVHEIPLEDPGLILSTWHHAVEGLDIEVVRKGVETFGRLIATTGTFTCDDDFLPAFRSGWTCLVVLPDRETFAVRAGIAPGERAEAARRMFDLMGRGTNLDRVTYTNLRDLTSHYPGFSALVCYRPFSKQEIVGFARQGTLLPGGITRFSVPKRVLEFSIPLALLIEEGPIESKRVAIDRMVQDKIGARQIRFYAEPTFHFDE